MRPLCMLTHFGRNDGRCLLVLRCESDDGFTVLRVSSTLMSESNVLEVVSVAMCPPEGGFSYL